MLIFYLSLFKKILVCVARNFCSDMQQVVRVKCENSRNACIQCDAIMDWVYGIFQSRIFNSCRGGQFVDNRETGGPRENHRPSGNDLTNLFTLENVPKFYCIYSNRQRHILLKLVDLSLVAIWYYHLWTREQLLII